MGSICYIDTNPNRWKVRETNKKLKEEYGGEELLEVCYGSLDDDPGGAFDMEMYMRKSIYEKLIAGKYKVSPESKWKRKLIVLDVAGNEVPPVGVVCY